MRQLLFIDRDGTLCKEPADYQVDRLDKIRLLEYVIPSLTELKALGYEFIMVSNQDGLGTPSFPQADFELTHNFILELFAAQGIEFADILICPHFEEDRCSCRKPQLGLVNQYLADPHWDRKRAAVIGDRDSDIQLAANMGLPSFLLQDSGENSCSWPDIVRQLKATGRRAAVTRQTKETDIAVSVDLDGSGHAAIDTGIEFFDHMLEQIARHSGIDLTIRCRGDLGIDDHHSVEDIGLALGSCLLEALGPKLGISRYGFVLPMDDVLAQVALDLGGRPYFVFTGEFSREKIGELATEMIPHFFRSLSESLRANLHMSVSSGNSHHMAESLFKGFARTLRQAIARGEGDFSLPSTKGVL